MYMIGAALLTAQVYSYHVADMQFFKDKALYMNMIIKLFGTDTLSKLFLVLIVYDVTDRQDEEKRIY